MRKILRAVVPGDLGPSFRWLWSATTVGNAADGVLLTAGPLLVASITREPLAVAMALFLQRLPWFVFGLLAGVFVDRVDRRLLVMRVDLLRAILLTILAAAVAFDLHNLFIIYAVSFLLGTAETLSDNALQALVPMTVPKPGLGRANARKFASVMIANQLLGPPLGAFLFGLGLAVPFGFDAVCFVVVAALISKVRTEGAVPQLGPTRSVRREMLEGLRWLWSHPPVRTLAIMITAFNVTFGAGFSIMVLYAFERLGLGDFGFGLLLSAPAVGGVLGSAMFGWLERRFRYATLLRIGLVIEAGTHLALALTRSPYLAGGVLAAFGLHAVVWGTTSTTVRQKLVPDALHGRVTSVYLVGALGALAFGSLAGGLIGQQWGVTAPLWFAFLTSALILVPIWRSIGDVSSGAETRENS